MIWHSEEVIGLDAAIEAMNRLLPQVNARSSACIAFQLMGRVTLLVFEKPWPRTSFALFGNFSTPEVDQILKSIERSGLEVFDNTKFLSGRRGFSFAAPNQGVDLNTTCRTLLESLLKDNNIVVQGVDCSGGEMLVWKT